MIGVDAADRGFIASHLGELPAFRRVFESGSVHRIDSTAAWLTGSVWPTFYTGTMPGEHGVYHHLQWDSERMRLRRVSPEWLECRPFWEELEARGRRVAVLDVPMTMGTYSKKGVEVANWGSHDQLGAMAGNTAELTREVGRRFGSHPMGAEIPVNKSAGEVARIRRNLVEGARKKGEFARWMLGSKAWDFALVVFGETHRGGHILWPEGEESADAILDVYRAVDAALGEMLSALDLEATTVVVFALHGMGPNTAQEHFVPRMLDAANAAWMGQERRQEGGNAPSAGQRSLMRTLREKVPAGLQNAIAQAVPVSVRDWVVIRQISSGYEWGKTPGFPLLADLNGYLRFNVRGREMEGMMEAGSARGESYVEWLCEALGSFRVAETGEPLVREIRLAKQAFPGARTDRLPDVMVQWAPAAPAERIVSEKLGTIEGKIATGRAGNHRFDGFCAIRGWDESRCAAPEPRDIVGLSEIARIFGRA